MPFAGSRDRVFYTIVVRVKHADDQEQYIIRRYFLYHASQFSFSFFTYGGLKRVINILKPSDGPWDCRSDLSFIAILSLYCVRNQIITLNNAST
jgi:hypothetical protein